MSAEILWIHQCVLEAVFQLRSFVRLPTHSQIDLDTETSTEMLVCFPFLLNLPE